MFGRNHKQHSVRCSNKKIEILTFNIILIALFQYIVRESKYIYLLVRCRVYMFRGGGSPDKASSHKSTSRNIDLITMTCSVCLLGVWK